MSEDAAFAGLSEYVTPKQAARGRSLFADGRLPLALLTERSHFYNRARVRGVKVSQLVILVNSSQASWLIEECCRK